jgi:hypothetical protein
MQQTKLEFDLLMLWTISGNYFWELFCFATREPLTVVRAVIAADTSTGFTTTEVPVALMSGVPLISADIGRLFCMIPPCVDF